MKIDITSKASEKLKNILEEKNTPSAKVRIFLAGIG
jgi:Fe-S cluster assembly iron-binding protein IscA